MAQMSAIPARDRDARVVAGVCAGLGRALRVDPTLIRLLFAMLTLAAGMGIVLYLAAWLLMPAHEGKDVSGARTALGLATIALACVAALAGLGLPAFVLLGAALIVAGLAFWWRRQRRVLGASLVAGGAVVVLTGGSGLGSGGPLLTPAVFAGGLLLVVGPWLWRLWHERDAERTARIRSEERAEVAARVHDSVLQTLALIQKDAEDPRRVAALARRQERELRSWLFRPYGDHSLVAGLDEAAAEVEELHGVRVEVAASGNADLTDDVRAVVLAAREAMANAAKFSGADEISVYAEANGDGINVFVRDRGVGFERDQVPQERKGLSESIEGRMTRHGGSAQVRSTPGEGTEIELHLPGGSE
jgi:signal transduction histidine kinase